MKLYEMYTPFDRLNEEEQRKFIINYREKRAEVIQNHIASFSSKRKKKASKPKLSKEEKLLLKKLGISSLKSLLT